MARLARVVVPGIPHHVNQRGNRRQTTFFNDGDYQAYRDLMAERCALHDVEVWAYCLMPNHVHLIAVPASEDGLRRAIGEAHRRYTRRINTRAELLGHLWQGRFTSFPMDEAHLLMAARYVELNPVLAGLAKTAGNWPWSSAAAHLKGADDGLVRVGSLLERVEDWRAFLDGGLGDGEAETVRRHAHTGRPLGDDDFVAGLEKKLKRPLGARKRGRKPKTKPKN